jgi:hypothetical protein
MSLFSEIEKTIERGFRKWTEHMFGPAQSDELLLVHRAILEEIEGKVQTVARGRRVFPYSHLVVTLVSADPDRRAVFQTAFGERLQTDVREALKGAGCEVSRGFALDVRTSETGEKTFEIEYGLEAPKAPAASSPARVILVKGKAERAEYVLDKARINIGRLAELTDSEQRVVRRNDIVFEEGGDEANATVSRKHAHIRLADGDYRIWDDESEFGTRVFRDGRPIEVPKGNRRGEKLRSGDEIYLGRACLRFEC